MAGLVFTLDLVDGIFNRSDARSYVSVAIPMHLLSFCKALSPNFIEIFSFQIPKQEDFFYLLFFFS